MSIDKKELRKIFTEDRYRVQIFKEKGFVRKKCSNPDCGKNFWTLDPDRQTCGDTVCEGGYAFIGRKLADGFEDFNKTVSKWCDYFTRDGNGHTRIQEYPVVARWRDDIDFTIASIADFQPWVLNNVVLPPANPLVVPQPCIRFGGKGFNDVDNVGKTGRHLTMFIMGGQHSFNGSGKMLEAFDGRGKILGEGYWMDKCIEYNYRFLTEEMKIPPPEITYIEDIWAGGGNFGPCLESFGRGLEIVNSVFMQYQVLPDGSYKEIDLKVIDVGWGVERVGWFAHGFPTVYEATFGPVLDWLKKQTGISVDRTLHQEYAQTCGLLNVDEVDDPRKARAQLADKIGLSLEEMDKIIGPMEVLYAIADHMRTIVFSLADGAIPSNVGGGYNLRALLRRIFAFMERRGLNDNLDLAELAHKEIEFFKISYPRIVPAAETIDDILKIEAGRFKETRIKGMKHISQLLKRKKDISVEEIIDLYDSRGIPPETVGDIASELNVKLEIPEDIYVLIGDKHEKESQVKQDETLEARIGSKLKDVPDTKVLFYDPRNMFTFDFKAKVLKSFDNYLILDKTLMYPTGGGQMHDVGHINDLRVTAVEKIGGIVVHIVDLEKGRKSLPGEGSEISGKIDKDTRLDLMRQHTAAHIVNAAAKRVLGPHIWQAGAEKKRDRSRLDISHYKAITLEELRNIEREANRLVMANLPVQTSFMDRGFAENKYGFTLYQGGVVPGGTVRVVEIKGEDPRNYIPDTEGTLGEGNQGSDENPPTDVEACGGTHSPNTSFVGPIKLLSTQRIQDGICRLNFTCGLYSLESIYEGEDLLSNSAATFSVPMDQMPATCTRFFQEWKDRGKAITDLRNKLASVHADAFLAHVPDIVDIQTPSKSAEKIEVRAISLSPSNVDKDDIMPIITQVIRGIAKPSIAILLFPTEDEKARVVVGISRTAEDLGLDAGRIIQGIFTKIKGKGGGKGPTAQGIIDKPISPADLLVELKNIAKENPALFFRK